VLDSSAVLAVFFQERGAELIAAIARNALLSTVNVTEIHTRMIHRNSEFDQAWGWIVGLGCQFCVFTDKQARIAAELLPITRPFGLSLADRACLALAIDRKATVYTTDRIWTKFDLGLRIEVIR
jgi:ribonuclease VapC